MNNKSFWCSYF